MRGPLIFALSLAIAGCSDDEKPPPPPRGMFDGGPVCPGASSRPPSAAGDVDGDGTPNDSDPDADGDGIDNQSEQLGGFSCAGPDPDGDGTPSWLETDSDDDGLNDDTEVAGSSDPYDPDSDADGYGDLVELGAATSPTDPASQPSRLVWIGALPSGATETITLDFVNRIESADVFFLFDTTGTMGGERDNLVSGMTDTIVPGVVAAIPDVWVGAAGYEDYPSGGYGSSTAHDLPFYLLSAIIAPDVDTRQPASSGGVLIGGDNGVADILDAIEGLEIKDGQDFPEATVPALYATATGEGLAWPDGEVRAQDGCPSGTRGYACFRSDALPIVILIGDAAFHNGPDAAEPYADIPTAPTYDQAVSALVDLGARVVGIYSGDPTDPARGHFQRVASDTHAVQPDGSPMVFDIMTDGSGLSTTVVDGVASLAAGRTQDVTARAFAGGSHPSGGDPLALLSSLETGEAGSYDSKDTTTFHLLEAGTDFHYVVTLTGTVAPADEGQAFLIGVGAVDEEGATFATRRLLAIVPPDGRTLDIVKP